MHFLFFSFCLTVCLTGASALRILNKHMNCSWQGLDNCKINNCSDKGRVPRQSAPTGPDSLGVDVSKDKQGRIPVLNVSWKINDDGSFQNLTGSKINIVDENTNESLCVQFTYTLQTLQNQKHKWYIFWNEVMVEFGHRYTVTVSNLPEPMIGSDKDKKNHTITIPGCDDKRIQQVQKCLENGSMWSPHVDAVVDTIKPRMLSILVLFEASQYSEKYTVSIWNSGKLYPMNVSKENSTSLNVTFEFWLWQLEQCEMSIKVQPFFNQCKNYCWSPKKTINYCKYYPTRTSLIKTTVLLLVICGCLVLLWRASHKDPLNISSSAAREPQVFQVRERKRILIIYSLDHPLYKNIVLKLCAFLMNKCGMEVVLDLLDSTTVGILGSIQWLDMHKEKIEKSSDKILVLCSRGVQAKWRAMCGDRQVFLREDACSPVGDMLTLSLSLLVPHFIRSASFKKYIVAYFDAVSSEEDIPSPFNITVRYKLMKQFEEVFFRILEIDKHEPGRVNQVEGLSEENYHLCPSGRALHDAIEAFHAYQLENPRWFEDELLESSELELKETSHKIYKSYDITTSLITTSVLGPTQIFNEHVTTNEIDFTVAPTTFYMSETPQMCSSLDLMQPMLQLRAELGLEPISADRNTGH